MSHTFPFQLISEEVVEMLHAANAYHADLRSDFDLNMEILDVLGYFTPHVWSQHPARADQAHELADDLLLLCVVVGSIFRSSHDLSPQGLIAERAWHISLGVTDRFGRLCENPPWLHDSIESWHRKNAEKGRTPVPPRELEVAAGALLSESADDWRALIKDLISVVKFPKPVEEPPSVSRHYGAGAPSQATEAADAYVAHKAAELYRNGGSKPIQ